MHIPTKKLNRILQVDISSRCNLSCSNCTRALAQHRKPDMTPSQFEKAVLASKDWILREKGLIAIFGGNPTLSEYFDECCAILAEHLPEENRGLWTNDLCGKGETIRRYFGPSSYFNLIAHGKPEAAAEMRRELPWAIAHGGDRPSYHASILVAAQDFVKDESRLWELVDQCDYDRKWSAVVMQEAPDWQALGGYSCEIAGSHARLNGKALGVPVEPGWLDLLEDSFRHQYDFACRRCGGCLKLDGIRDLDYVDQYSATNKHIVGLTVSRKRKLVEVTDFNGDVERVSDPTNYLAPKRSLAEVGA